MLFIGSGELAVTLKESTKKIIYFITRNINFEEVNDNLIPGFFEHKNIIL